MARVDTIGKYPYKGEFPSEPPAEVESIQRKITLIEKALSAQEIACRVARAAACENFCQEIADDLTMIHSDVVRAGQDFLEDIYKLTLLKGKESTAK